MATTASFKQQCPSCEAMVPIRDANLIGRKIVVNGMPLEIVGVAAPGFFGTRAGMAPEFWLPTTMQSAVHYAQHYSQTEAAVFDQPWIPQPDIRWLPWVSDRARAWSR